MRASGRQALVGAHVLAQAVVAAALIGLAQEIGVWTPHLPLPWWLVGLGFLAVESSALHVEIRRETHTLSLSGIPLLLGMLSLSPIALVLVRLAGSAVALVGIRRRSGMKLLWNLSLHAMETGAAALVALHAFENGPPHTFLSWIILLAAVLLAELISLVSVPLVITMAEGELRLSLFAQIGRSQLLAVVSSTFAVVCAAAMIDLPSLAVLVLVPLMGVVVLLRMLGRLGKEHHDLQQLHGFTTAISDRDSLDAGLAQLAVILRADWAALAVRQDAGTVLARTHRDGMPNDELIEVPDVGGGLREAPGLHRSGGFDGVGGTVREEAPANGLLEIGEEAPSTDAAAILLALGGTRGLALPVSDPAGGAAHLLVADRLGAADRFGPQEARLFASLASTLAARLSADRLLERLEVQARIDPLTGLANRVTFEAELDRRIGEGDRSGAVLLIDMDRFKDVNDSLGHQFGDRLLQAVAERLITHLRQGDKVARLGGDEFVALVDLPPGADLGNELGGLIDRLNTPIELEGVSLDMAASIGVAEWPADSTSGAELLRLADIAMYEAKRTHQQWVKYDPSIGYASADRLALVGELRDAIANRDLKIFLQPQVRADDRRLVGAEALLRWQHPVHGLLPPGEFLGLVERSPLAGPVTRYVVEEAVAALADLRARGVDITVSINLTARDVLDRTLPQTVAAVILAEEVPPDAVTFEVTESSLIVDLEAGIETLVALQALGCRTSVDDFGTGYSSLQYLQRLPIDEVKIDRTFVADAVTDANSAAIVGSVTTLIRDLGHEVVAEGVEDEATLELLRRFRCDLIQGYHIARPMPVDDFREWALARRVNAPARAR